MMRKKQKAQTIYKRGTNGTQTRATFFVFLTLSLFLFMGIQFSFTMKSGNILAPIVRVNSGGSNVWKLMLE